jgi:predicted dehydrogenase
MNQVPAILDAEKKYGKKVKVTFNYRYCPLASENVRAIAE